MSGAHALRMATRRNGGDAHEALLPWESAQVFDVLARQFLDEFAPSGATERILVDRLIWTAWRRRRLVLAERAAHLAAFDEQCDDYRAERIVKRAGVRDQRVIKRIELADVVAGDAVGDAADRRDRAADRKATQTALGMLSRGSSDGYAKAAAALHADTRSWWEDALAGETDAERAWSATAEDLETFLTEIVAPVDDVMDAEIEARPAVRLQAHGESLAPDRMERLLSIDARLDRQFEKTLSMLLQLQSLRATRPTKVIASRG